MEVRGSGEVGPLVLEAKHFRRGPNYLMLIPHQVMAAPGVEVLKLNPSMLVLQVDAPEPTPPRWELVEATGARAVLSTHADVKACVKAQGEAQTTRRTLMCLQEGRR